MGLHADLTMQFDIRHQRTNTKNHDAEIIFLS